jgi:hypothetical protein
VVAAAPGKASKSWLVFVAPGGRAPFGMPSRGPYGSFAFNARAREDGKLDPVK